MSSKLNDDALKFSKRYSQEELLYFRHVINLAMSLQLQDKLEHEEFELEEHQSYKTCTSCGKKFISNGDNDDWYGAEKGWCESCS